ncbi:MAG TPA: ABC-F family ATP-binding cassette domain-containing protein [Polyangia bacterium]|jgi:ATPase subunit of ABC transporter with duplicated ATPase domains|nr:ABC-F family ATP-binding cassette domain-containing protein [Polyangia bacterium]
MIATRRLAKEYGARTLFEEVSLQLNAGSRYGLVGANGSGKSTFLRIVAGDEGASEGTVSLQARARVGVLRQDRFLDDDAIILDLAMRGDVVVSDALAEQRRIAAGDSGEGIDHNRVADLEDLIAAHDGYTLEARASEVLAGLGIATPTHRSPLSTLSGGFKLRVLLAQVLLGGADVLLLDEPTNHLDILSIRWLEKFLDGYTGCAVVISHDQRFLDNVTSHTLDVDYRTITLYTGNYATFAVEKAATRARKEAAVARAEDEIARKRAFVERFGAKNTKATQAQSRLKQIERIEVEELIESSRRSPLFRIAPERPSGKDVLAIEGISKAYGEKRVLTDVGLLVRRGERVGIIGPNGLGKSTLLKIVVERLAADAGRVRWGHEVRIGYFPQDHREVLDDGETTPLEKLWSVCPGESPQAVRGQLGRVLFSGEDVDKKIRLLSGGEAARLIFALLVVQKPNVLVLDEPTNHLDLEAIAALVEALRAFAGSIIFVSHDRWFVSQLATRIVELTPQGPRDFPGSYAEYLARCGDDHLDADTVVLKAKPLRGETQGDPQWEQKKRRRNRLARLPVLRDKVLADIEAAETRKVEIQRLYCSPGFFEETSKEAIALLEKEQAELDPRIEALMAQWELLEREIAEAATEQP